MFLTPHVRFPFSVFTLSVWIADWTASAFLIQGEELQTHQLSFHKLSHSVGGYADPAPPHPAPPRSSGTAGRCFLLFKPSSLTSLAPLTIHFFHWVVSVLYSTATGELSPLTPVLFLAMLVKENYQGKDTQHSPSMQSGLCSTSFSKAPMTLSLLEIMTVCSRNLVCS